MAVPTPVDPGLDGAGGEVMGQAVDALGEIGLGEPAQRLVAQTGGEHGRGEQADGVDGGQRLEGRADVAAVADNLHARLYDQGVESSGHGSGHGGIRSHVQDARCKPLATRCERQRHSHGQRHELHARPADAAVGLAPLVVHFLHGLPVDIIAGRDLDHPFQARSLGQLRDILLEVAGFLVFDHHALGGGEGQVMSKSEKKPGWTGLSLV
jgi:hypothetical protein